MDLKSIGNAGAKSLKGSVEKLFEECGNSDENKLQIAMLALSHISNSLPDITEIIKKSDLTKINADMLGHISSCKTIARSVLEVLEGEENE